MRNLINTSNMMKDTKLHTAARWRFRGHIACRSYEQQNVAIGQARENVCCRNADSMRAIILHTEKNVLLGKPGAFFMELLQRRFSEIFMSSNSVCAHFEPQVSKMCSTNSFDVP